MVSRLEFQEITSGLNARCLNRVIALEKFEDESWGNVVIHFDQQFYARIVRLLEAIKALHDTGFRQKISKRIT